MQDLVNLFGLLRPIDFAVAVMWAASTALVLTWLGVTAALLLQHWARQWWRTSPLRAATHAPGRVLKSRRGPETDGAR